MHPHVDDYDDITINTFTVATTTIKSIDSKRLSEFYMKHNPSMVDKVDETLEKYEGREDKLFRKLEAKYGEAAAVDPENDEKDEDNDDRNYAAEEKEVARMIYEELQERNLIPSSTELSSIQLFDNNSGGGSKKKKEEEDVRSSSSSQEEDDDGSGGGVTRRNSGTMLSLRKSIGAGVRTSSIMISKSADSLKESTLSKKVVSLGQSTSKSAVSLKESTSKKVGSLKKSTSKSVRTAGLRLREQA